MPNFNYKAINAEGQKIKGALEAKSVEDAQSKLASQGMLPLEVKAGKGSKKSSTASSFFNKVTVPDIIMFTKQFRTMLRSGIPILQIFSILSEQSKNPNLKTAMATMEQEVREGATMTLVFERQPAIF